MSNFSFLQKEWFAIHDSATKAESYLNTDARAACWYARMTLEQIVDWLYKYDPNYKSYEASLGARIYDTTFRKNAGETIFEKATVVIQIGNRAAHAKAAKYNDAVVAITELFHVSYWLARTYCTKERPQPNLQFNTSNIPTQAPSSAITLEQLKKQEETLKQQQAENDALKDKFKSFDAIQAELAQLRTEIANAKAANQSVVDSHDYNEAQTRDYFIDILLNEAGWKLDRKDDREFEVQVMPNNKGVGYVDYVLWGDDGKPLAVVEAKSSRKDARVGQQQAKLYADCLEARYKRRPVIFYTNGYEHWFWNDTQAAPRRVEGFYTKDELELLMQRRTSKLPLAITAINEGIAGRSYQQQAIRSVTEAIEQHNQRRSLVVMATGAGKTRTVIALVDLLVRCNWAKRVLFLADRVSLVKQATKAFVKFSPNLSVVNLLDNAESQGRVYVSTYPTMLGLINDVSSEVKRFGVGHFDLIIVDEAHRSIYSKYSALFRYFDGYLVGLTATPKDEVDRNTYGLFELQKGVPTYAYGLEEAIADAYLVPPKSQSVPLKFIREGIKYEDLSDEEQQQWDELDWGEDEAPDEINAASLNNGLFNKDTVDNVFKHLMTNGEHVASGNCLGKTIIFAKNTKHAEFIAERFNANYPQYNGEFARVITYQTNYVQKLIDDFSSKDKMPHIAISVDMLDTGIDVPEVLNLVFFKLVRSKTKFWQMIGRGTRLCENLYAPNQHKTFFNVFDYCENIEYFSSNIDKKEAPVADSLDTKLFKSRVELITALDAKDSKNTLRNDTAKYLHERVANMTLNNFIVRPKRKQVEKFSQYENWATLSKADATELSTELAALPTQLNEAEEEAKRFDLMILRAQLCILQGNKGFERLKTSIMDIVSALELQDSIPAIRNQMPLIQSMTTEEWWQDVTVGILEHARVQLRLLIKLLEKVKRPIIYIDMVDEMGEATEIQLPLKQVGLDYDRFKNKTRDFLLKHEDKLAVQKLRRNLPITPTDLNELEKILLEQAVNDVDLVQQAKAESGGLGLFVRALIGLERTAAQEAMSEFLNDAAATSTQITFIKMIVDFLTHNGAITDALLYNAPFTDVAPCGPEDIFSAAKIIQLDAKIKEIREHAMAYTDDVKAA